MNENETTVEETAKSNRKREITATVTSGAVAVVLGIVSQALIGKVTTEVQNRISKKTETK